MKITPAIGIPGLAITGIAAGLPTPVVVLCVLAVILCVLATSFLIYLIRLEQVRRDDDFRTKILTSTADLPAGECAAVLCGLTRTLRTSEGPPPADPSVPETAP